MHLCPLTPNRLPLARQLSTVYPSPFIRGPCYFPFAGNASSSLRLSSRTFYPRLTQETQICDLRILADKPLLLVKIDASGLGHSRRLRFCNEAPCGTPSARDNPFRGNGIHRGDRGVGGTHPEGG